MEHIWYTFITCVITSQYRDLWPVVCYLYSCPKPCKCTLKQSAKRIPECASFHHSETLGCQPNAEHSSLFIYFEVVWILVILSFSSGKITWSMLTQDLFVSEGDVVDFFPLSLEIFKVRICSSYTGFLAYIRGLGNAHECNHGDMPLCISHILIGKIENPKYHSQ